MKLTPVLFLSFTLFFLVFSCKQSDDTIDPLATKANPDWTTESHAKEGVPNYDIVFPQENVNTLEITLGKTNWELLKADMVAKSYGTFGVGGTQTGGGGAVGGGPAVEQLVVAEQLVELYQVLEKNPLILKQR